MCRTEAFNWDYCKFHLYIFFEDHNNIVMEVAGRGIGQVALLAG